MTGPGIGYALADVAFGVFVVGCLIFAAGLDLNGERWGWPWLWRLLDRWRRRG